ncbi:MAG: CoA-binding protein [Candidatus Parvarchaeota archaeon]|nr:CoA-binding protein [Candidatus Jingweiarchaeum tengchongense]MCW1298002.1 CoA-binding protein [Candidatus Jingweiarchaeum tengchongense]MCW1300197.1 CoA-binding protein [Candidatus Jingweiarchaeum tengchongense]MCW1304407.1 CoA-binding protein [Candidatus Jingweiarchaeum tengchongense]MCW1305958.1 CoA-binding protein [Candidatus Jingweiarchaeum tengchongense]
MKKKDDIDYFFNPRTIAVIGASRFENKVGNVVFKNLLASKRDVFPVNKNVDKIMNYNCYPSILKIPVDIDLAVICLPAPEVPNIMKECARKKVKAAIIIPSGFSEIGEKGKKIEEEVIKIAKKANIRIIGPNCLGLIDTRQKLNTTFFDKIPKVGKMAFISQSGALGVAILDWATKENFGFSKFISIGNAVDIGFSELLNYIKNDEETKVIGLYIESLKDGREFIDACKNTAKEKEIIVLKAGKGEAGKRAAFSHTASMAGSDDVYNAVFKQCGVIRVEKVEDLFELSLILQMNKRINGNKVLIITNGGGPGVITTDAFESYGFDVVKLPENVIKQINNVLPEHWSHNNPIDVVGDAQADRYRSVFNIIKNENFYDFLVCILTPQAMTQPEETARALVTLNNEINKPCFACFWGGEKVEKAKEILRNNNLLNFEDPFKLARLLSYVLSKNR